MHKLLKAILKFYPYLYSWVEYSPMVQETGIHSILGRFKTKDSKNDTVLLNTQHNNVRIKSKVEQSREWSSTLSYSSV